MKNNSGKTNTTGIAFTTKEILLDMIGNNRAADERNESNHTGSGQGVVGRVGSAKCDPFATSFSKKSLTGEDEP